MMLALSVLLVLAMGHPTLYPGMKAVPMEERDGVPPVLSWHVHLVYSLYPTDIEEALAIREEARRAFSPFLGDDCDGRYDNGRLCMITDHDLHTTLMGGPFPAGEWSIFVPVPYYGLVMPWMTQHRGRFSVLVHPNTGYEQSDHDEWALWAGKPWPLITDPQVLGNRGERSNEIGHVPGDAGNMQCLPQNGRCGVPGSEKMQPCCKGLWCSCPSFSYTCRCVTPFIQ